MPEAFAVDCRVPDAPARIAATYARHGAVLCRGLLSPAQDFAGIRAAVKSIAHMQALRFAIPVTDHYSRAVMDLERVDHALVSGVYDIVNSHPELYRLAAHDQLRRTIGALLAGERIADVIVNGFQLRIDLPGNESELLGWHRDIDYFSGFPEEGIVLWLPLEDVTAESGGISIVPQRFSRQDFATAEVMNSWPGRKPHRVYEIRDPENRLSRADRPVRVTCSSGDGLLFNMLSVHRSEPNTSDDIRWTVQYRYYPARQVAEAKLDRAQLERR